MSSDCEIVMVAAVARNRVIGANGTMPWHLPADLRHAKKLTMGHVLVMGRATFESIGRPLPGRTNVVLTSDLHWQHDGVAVVRCLPEAVRRFAPGPLMIFGGGRVYAHTMPYADRLEITHIVAEPDGDTLFPPIDPAVWVERAREDHEGFAFVTYLRRAGEPADLRVRPRGQTSNAAEGRPRWPGDRPAGASFDGLE